MDSRVGLSLQVYGVLYEATSAQVWVLGITAAPRGRLMALEIDVLPSSMEVVQRVPSAIVRRDVLGVRGMVSLPVF